ncbi:MAG: choice-of-anchor Q domain-containing protein [Leucobacter sp.]
MTFALNRPARLSAAALALGALVAGVGLVSVSAPAHAATFSVTTTADVSDAAGCASGIADPGPDGLWSLREAVCLANSTFGPDEILLPAGVYPLNSPLEVTDKVSIIGAGMNTTTIDASATEKAIDTYAMTGNGIALEQLTVIGGDATSSGIPEGGAISSFGMDVFLNSVRITGGTAVSGGGIAAIYGSLTLLDSIIEGNTATGSGGGVFAVGSFYMQRTTVSGNTATTGGGLVLESSGSDFSTIEQSTISGNTASGNGGSIALPASHQGQTVVSDTTIVGNTAGGSGGAVHSAGGAAGEILFSSSTVTGNVAPTVGGIAQSSGTVTVQYSIVAENAGGDLSGTIGGNGNIVGVAGGTVIDGAANNRAGTVEAPLDPRLRALGSFGGPTQTRVPLPDSPAIDTAIGCGAVDQRGEARPAGAGCDVGAVELTAAPDTTIVTGPASPTGSDEATFALSAAAGTGPYTFECDLGPTGVFEACSNNPIFGGLLDGSHTLAVRAVDALGATDPSAAGYTWTVDLTAPVVVWGAVSMGTAPDSASSFAFTATDASGIAGFECSLDGAAFAACTSPVTTSALAAGAHSFRVRAIDTVGNVGEIAERSWTVASAAAGGNTPAAEEIAKTGAEPLNVALAAALALLLAGSLILTTRIRRRA